MAIDKDRLPFVLNRKISERPPADCLPFALSRKLGELGESVAVVSPTTPIEAPKPQNPKTPLDSLSLGAWVYR